MARASVSMETGGSVVARGGGGKLQHIVCGGGGSQGPLPLGDLTAVPGTVFGGALRRTDDLGFFQAVPLVQVVGGDRVRATVHHSGVQSVGHGEGLQMAS